jgi:SAM-dependent methyltransferase
MLELLVVLQTHTLSNNQSHITRYMSRDRGEISYRCVKSLFNTIEWCLKKESDKIKIKLKIFDDHSDERFLSRLKKMIASAAFPVEFEALTTRGILPSILACFEYGKANGQDLVYFVQDDYLHYESAIWEMVDAYFQFKEETQSEICIYPFDDPYRYYIRPPATGAILLGSKRHWKVSHWTASCFMVPHHTIVDNWDLFYDFCFHAIDSTMEDDTLNKLFSERSHLLFSPIPSVALHSQSDIEKDPYIDWVSLWEKFADSEINYEHLFSTDKKIVLNVGAGNSTLKNQTGYFSDWQEVRVDVADCKPDIVSTIVDLKEIPNAAVDAIWASHVIEHQYWHDLPRVFKNFLRVLKPNGFAVIRVPNLASISHLITNKLLEPIPDYFTGSLPVAPIDMIYSHRALVEKYEDPMIHRTGFTPSSLESILNSLNISAYIQNRGYEIVCVIYKGQEPIDAIQSPLLIL